MLIAAMIVIALIFINYSDGSTAISASSLSFSANSTATITSIESSPFTLNVDGTTDNGQGNGRYTITFSATGLPESFSGNWTATRTKGTGITN